MENLQNNIQKLWENNCICITPSYNKTKALAITSIKSSFVNRLTINLKENYTKESNSEIYESGPLLKQVRDEINNNKIQFILNDKPYALAKCSVSKKGMLQISIKPERLPYDDILENTKLPDIANEWKACGKDETMAKDDILFMEDDSDYMRERNK